VRHAYSVYCLYTSACTFFLSNFSLIILTSFTF
jgi:hypothetical protein